jgi:glycosyltransferase involved in cell wall biosynthesis
MSPEPAAPIRVLRVIARLNTGGPALHVAYLAAGLRPRGYETTLVAGSLARGESSMSFVAEEAGVPIVRLPQLHRDISAFYDARSVTRLVELIRRDRPHILHTHTAKAGAVGRIAALLSGAARPPIVVHTFHGHVLNGYFGPVPAEVFRRVERRLARDTTRLVAVSPEVRDDLVRLGVAPKEKFSVIRLGIELDDRTHAGEAARTQFRRLFGVPDDRFVVGWIGRMTAVKRVPDVLEAFRRLLDRGVEATLCLVGEGPDREETERLARRLGIMRSCLFVGYQRDVAPYYALFDTFLLASANEGTPVVAIEALAAGVPVVATGVGGVADVVSEGEDGFLVERGDVAALAERMERLARDPELRRTMGATGRQRVPARYAVERLIDDTDELYRSLLAEAGLPAPLDARRLATQ